MFLAARRKKRRLPFGAPAQFMLQSRRFHGCHRHALAVTTSTTSSKMRSAFRRPSPAASKPVCAGTNERLSRFPDGPSDARAEQNKKDTDKQRRMMG